MNRKAVKVLIKSYPLEMVDPFPIYEYLIEEYEIKLRYSDFIGLYTEIKKEIELHLEISELSKNQRRLKNMVNFWITTTPSDFSFKDLTSTLIVTLESLVNYYERKESKA